MTRFMMASKRSGRKRAINQFLAQNYQLSGVAGEGSPAKKARTSPKSPKGGASPAATPGPSKPPPTLMPFLSIDVAKLDRGWSASMKLGLINGKTRIKVTPAGDIGSNVKTVPVQSPLKPVKVVEKEVVKTSDPAKPVLGPEEKAALEKRKLAKKLAKMMKKKMGEGTSLVGTEEAAKTSSEHGVKSEDKGEKKMHSHSHYESKHLPKIPKISKHSHKEGKKEKHHHHHHHHHGDKKHKSDSVKHSLSEESDLSLKQKTKSADKESSSSTKHKHAALMEVDLFGTIAPSKKPASATKKHRRSTPERQHKPLAITPSTSKGECHPKESQNKDESLAETAFSKAVSYKPKKSWLAEAARDNYAAPPQATFAGDNPWMMTQRDIVDERKSQLDSYSRSMSAEECESRATSEKIQRLAAAVYDYPRRSSADTGGAPAFGRQVEPGASHDPQFGSYWLTSEDNPSVQRHEHLSYPSSSGHEFSSHSQQPASRQFYESTKILPLMDMIAQPSELQPLSKRKRTLSEFDPKAPPMPAALMPRMDAPGTSPPFALEPGKRGLESPRSPRMTSPPFSHFPKQSARASHEQLSPAGSSGPFRHDKQGIHDVPGSFNGSNASYWANQGAHEKMEFLDDDGRESVSSSSTGRADTPHSFDSITGRFRGVSGENLAGFSPGSWWDSKAASLAPSHQGMRKSRKGNGEEGEALSDQASQKSGNSDKSDIDVRAEIRKFREGRRKSSESRDGDSHSLTVSLSERQNDGVQPGMLQHRRHSSGASLGRTTVGDAQIPDVSSVHTPHIASQLTSVTVSGMSGGSRDPRMSRATYVRRRTISGGEADVTALTSSSKASKDDNVSPPIPDEEAPPPLPPDPESAPLPDEPLSALSVNVSLSSTSAPGQTPPLSQTPPIKPDDPYCQPLPPGVDHPTSIPEITPPIMDPRFPPPAFPPGMFPPGMDPSVPPPNIFPAVDPLLLLPGVMQPGMLPPAIESTILPPGIIPPAIDPGYPTRVSDASVTTPTTVTMSANNTGTTPAIHTTSAPWSRDFNKRRFASHYAIEATKKMEFKRAKSKILSVLTLSASNEPYIDDPDDFSPEESDGDVLKTNVEKEPPPAPDDFVLELKSKKKADEESYYVNDTSEADSDKYLVIKSKPSVVTKRHNDVYVSPKTSYQCLLDKCRRILLKEPIVYIHGLGKAVYRALELAMELKKEYVVMTMSVHTNSEKLSDELIPVDGDEPEVRDRSASSVHITLTNLDLGGPVRVPKRRPVKGNQAKPKVQPRPQMRLPPPPPPPARQPRPLLRPRGPRPLIMNRPPRVQPLMGIRNLRFQGPSWR